MRGKIPDGSMCVLVMMCRRILAPHVVTMLAGNEPESTIGRAGGVRPFGVAVPCPYRCNPALSLSIRLSPAFALGSTQSFRTAISMRPITN
jgi:hypothetical protein